MSITNLRYFYVFLRREGLMTLAQVLEQIGVEVEQVRASLLITESFPCRRPDRRVQRLESVEEVLYIMVFRDFVMFVARTFGIHRF